MRVARPVTLNPEQRRDLEQHSRARSLSARWVERARIVLRAADGLQDQQIAEATDAQYFLATSDADLKKVYENLTTELVLRSQKTEVTALFTLVAAMFSVVASGLSYFINETIARARYSPNTSRITPQISPSVA